MCPGSVRSIASRRVARNGQLPWRTVAFVSLPTISSHVAVGTRLDLGQTLLWLSCGRHSVPFSFSPFLFRRLFPIDNTICPFSRSTKATARALTRGDAESDVTDAIYETAINFSTSTMHAPGTSVFCLQIGSRDSRHACNTVHNR